MSNRTKIVGGNMPRPPAPWRPDLVIIGQTCRNRLNERESAITGLSSLSREPVIEGQVSFANV
jgi:hypothetical protein